MNILGESGALALDEASFYITDESGSDLTGVSEWRGKLLTLESSIYE